MIVIAVILAACLSTSFYWMEKRQGDRLRDLSDRLAAQVEINSTMSQVLIIQAERMDALARAHTPYRNPNQDRHRAGSD